MQAEISHFVLIAAALCAVFLSLPTLLGSKSRAPLFVHLWKPALGITFAGLSFALIMLIWAFLTNDFSIAYVANNSNTSSTRFTRSLRCGGAMKAQCSYGYGRLQFGLRYLRFSPETMSYLNLECWVFCSVLQDLSVYF